MSRDKLPQLTVDELRALVDEDLEETQARIEAYEEHRAIEREACVDAKTTTERALDALQRPERFHGEHQAAEAWLKYNAPPHEFHVRKPRKENP